MDSAGISSLLEQLDDDIDDLEDALQPLVKQTLAETGPKLPLLDKAKLYVLVTYAVESMLFSYLRLHGVKAREHPVFTELTRVRQYFDKIEKAETPVEKRQHGVDKKAAARFIKAGLAGNNQPDLAKAEEQAKERARALLKSRVPSRKRSIEQVEAGDVQEEESDSDSSNPSMEVTDEAATPSKKKKKKRRKLKE